MVHVSDMVAATKQQGSIMNVGRECPLSPAGGDGEVARQRRSRVADSDPSDNSQRAAVLSTGTARTKNSLRLALSNAASSFATIFLAFQFFTNFLAVRVLASDDTSTTEAGTAAVSLPEARYSLNGIAAYVWRLTMMFVFCTAILLGLLWYFQEKLLFLPGVPRGARTPENNPPGLRRPDEHGVPYVDVKFPTQDGFILHGWFIRSSESSPTLIFFHGNAGNLGFRIPNFYHLHLHLRINIFAVSYRGFGHSHGVPSEEGVYKDASAAVDYLLSRADVNPKKLFVFGRSIGGAVAIELARRRPEQLRGVIVENTFTNLMDMVRVVFPLLRPLLPLIAQVQRLYMDNLTKVKMIKTPILFISGEKASATFTLRLL
eukprot:GHVT01005021.1.p1 GENE.GHVT01005021.1~~GHVT01005021.1.p1  ORF type:complete len:374 (-),score=30.04 GHVT01005021.1:1394-2515(-)